MIEETKLRAYHLEKVSINDKSFLILPCIEVKKDKIWQSCIIPY